MRPPVLFHPQLRSALPRSVRRELCSNLVFIRPKTTRSAPQPPNNESPSLKPKSASSSIPRAFPPASAGKTNKGPLRGPPEKILIYHGGTGRTMFLGMLRITTIFLFGVSCLVVAPAFMSSDFPSYLGPAIVVGGALPMLFVAYTSAPYVNFVHLVLPISVRRSREQAVQYAKKLPPTATLYLNTMKFNTIPRQSEVRLSDLVPDKSPIRPVSFRNKNPAPLPWWRGKTLQHFFTAEKSKPGKESTTFYPELWEHVYKQIQNRPRG
ncbi:hypothetical protein ASPVEDRAFT_79813 [Aspergillus versicolor CBS 583.65]|uniref:Uncharacterized protein n=1 Tax=Aspergillus versicolor CBS 583.65 TaxID=1036611 RepID=A0A1L9P9J7_ASPVE|nr:uncharacterized protein ASPVEDRAFT_79813 [Aspergillus versicolor CBS 583.65]OJI98152.1 hypothetical protein ASPVEDRAFT_79813 [Aspergillus versicolor CBS 583.65]